MEQLQACTLATAYPNWLPGWISRPAPLWHVTDSRTVAINVGLRPAVCSFCLIEDLENDRSQSMRLSWLSSITTICPIHRTPFIACCSDCSPNSLAHRNDWSRSARMHCRAVPKLFRSRSRFVGRVTIGLRCCSPGMSAALRSGRQSDRQPGRSATCQPKLDLVH